MVLRAGRVGFKHVGNAPSWKRLDAHACGVCGMYLFGCSTEAPNHVRRTLVSTRPDSCAPRKHRCDLLQVATLRHRGSGVASSIHVLQAHGSDVLLRHGTHLSVETCVYSTDANSPILSRHRLTQHEEGILDHLAGEARAGFMWLQHGC